MLSPQECYKNIYNELISYDTNLKEIEQKVQQAYQLYVDGCNEIDIKFKDALEENAQLILKVNAFIDIAKAHTSDLNKSVLPIPFDSGSLSRLTVQIDNSSKNDVHATQLYKEATGQLMFLEQQKGKIKEISEQQKLSVEKLYYDNKAVLESTKNAILSELANFFNSNETVNTLSFLLKTDGAIFGNTEEALLENIRPQETVSVGLLKMPIPTDDNIVALFAKKFGGFCDIYAKTINIPVGLAVNKGNVFVAEYSNDNENTLLSGIRNFILNVARYYDEKFDRICFIDPVRFSNNTLGCVSALAEGDNSFIDAVPLSTDEIRKKIKNIIEIEVDEERVPTGNYKKNIYVFHDVPEAYDAEVVTKIQHICVNAEHYEAIVILTHSLSSKGNVANDSLTYIQSMATNIICYGQDFKMKPFDDEMYNFKWYEEPQNLPESVVYKLIANKPIIDKSNDYIKRIGVSELPKYKKGVRRIENIPYGIDKEGNILSLDFENTNFATFICGASRSGKSTLLHTLITGILKKYHPDDIEMCLIDFKMTEFSRYTKHLPPNIRYIILDESPELVYDIIDRLTEIMQKRQSIFMGKWEKLGQVPPEKYMPAMFIIIDEFSVMSNIIADSVMSSRDNYIIKMQTLLAKGAALGMHFIFASQGFTSGTRGLNDFSKKQVQQRIAMKTEYSEIKDTLDLKSTSDGDKALMEQLPVYHALTRIPADEKGNHLKLAQVLYISDYDEQEKMIDNINNAVEAKPKYDVTDISAYIDKKSMIVDGNSYASYDSKIDLIKEHIEKNNASYSENDTVSMFVGEPQRMLPIYPIEIVNGFCENILIVAPMNEKASCSSMILSATKSLRLHNSQIECWTTKKNHVFRQLTNECGCRFDGIAIETEEICNKIREIKDSINQKKEANKMIVLFGFESVLMDMSYGTQNISVSAKNHKFSVLLDSEFTKESREDDAEDLNSILDFELNTDVDTPSVSVSSAVSVEVKSNNMSESLVDSIYDAREDLKYILTHGPRQGYHFMMIYNTIGEFEQSKMAPSLFKHKILFRTAKSDAAKIVSSACAGIISELKDHVYRYTDGLDEVSFRPYLHNGISLDGWALTNGDVTNITDEEEEYLL